MTNDEYERYMPRSDYPKGNGKCFQECQEKDCDCMKCEICLKAIDDYDNNKY